jgi:methylated-DNA-[protein]-cysteine S-methyltransferase
MNTAPPIAALTFLPPYMANFHQLFRTPRGFAGLTMVSDGEALTGLWFEGSRNAPELPPDGGALDLPVFRETRRWLEAYFSGRQPDFTPPYRIGGLTPFRRDVVDAMLAIPFGATATYGDIAAAIARRRGLAKMSAQAVGQAVGWNPICIVIPCHRVVGAAGALVGYGGGLRNKIALLRLEGALPHVRQPAGPREGAGR